MTAATTRILDIVSTSVQLSAPTKGTTCPVSAHAKELRSDRGPHPQLVSSWLEGGPEVESSEHLPERLLREEPVQRGRAAD